MKRGGTKTKDTLPKTSSNEIKDSFAEQWLLKIEKKKYLQYDEVFPGITTVLLDLKNDYDLVLVTLRNNAKNLLWELAELNLKKYFKCIISGKGPKKNLIESYLFKKSLISNYHMDQCFIVGDTEEDIRTGLELNIPTVSVTYGIRSQEFLRNFNHDYCINDFKDLINIVRGI